MKPRICICCGESIVEGRNALSRDPNVCASCSSMADGLTDSSVSGSAHRIADAIPDPQIQSLDAGVLFDS